jgi:putative PIN family toxin of toxin-antitoxin system
MTKIIMDTNVVVSALIKKDSIPALIFYHHLPHYELCLSTVIMEEYRQVLMRPKFQRFPAFF